MSKLSLVKKKLKSVKEVPTLKLRQASLYLKWQIVSLYENFLKKVTSLTSRLYASIKHHLKIITKLIVNKSNQLFKILLVEQTSLSKFIYGAGVYNLILVLCLGLPEGTINIGINIVDHALSEIIAGFLLFTAVIQIIGSRDIHNLGWLLFWEGILRWIVGFLLSIYGFLGHLGFTAGFLGLIDIYIGAIYLTRVPELTKKTPFDLISGK